MGDCSKIDDTAILSAAHELRHLTTKQKGADYVSLQNTGHCAGGREQRVIHRCDAGVIKKRIYLTMAGLDRSSHRNDSILVAHIQCEVLVVVVLDTAFATGATDDLPTFAEIVIGHFFADSFARSGDNDRFHVGILSMTASVKLATFR